MIAVHNSVGLLPVYAMATDEQSAAFCRGSFERMRHSRSPTGCGSDAGALQTSAVRDGDCYVLNGSRTG